MPPKRRHGAARWDWLGSVVRKYELGWAPLPLNDRLEHGDGAVALSGDLLTIAPIVLFARHLGVRPSHRPEPILSVMLRR